MPSTIRDLNTLAGPAADDYLLVSDTSDVTDRDKKMLAGKFPFKNGVPTADRVAVWGNADLLQDAGYLYTDVARLSTAQTLTALKTFTAGINLGGTTISSYTEGVGTGSWPLITGSSGNPTVVYSARNSVFQKTNNGYWIQAHIDVTTISGGSGQAQLNLPVAGNAFGFQVLTGYWLNISVGFFPFTAVIAPSTSFAFMVPPTGGIVAVGSLHSGDRIVYGGYYQT